MSDASINLDPIWQLLGDADRAVAELLSRSHDETNQLVLLAAGLAVWSHRNSHSCLDLGRIEQTLASDSDGDRNERVIPSVPLTATLVKALRSSANTTRIIEAGEKLDIAESLTDVRPLVLLGELLYTQRQFVDELIVAKEVNSRTVKELPAPSSEISELADRLLPGEGERGDKIQNAVAHAVLKHSFNVLTGGPGTGKTYTMATCIALMASSADSRSSGLRVAVCAPTGKAAARAKEAINNFLNGPNKPDQVDPKIIEMMSKIEPQTIHRLLGSTRMLKTRFRHDNTNKLPYDIIAIDETSMVPLQLMARFMDAVGINTRVLLVGDEAQLESVESGSILGEIVKSAPRMNNTVHSLKRVWRTESDSAIPYLAESIRSGDAEGAIEKLTDKGKGIEWIEIENPRKAIDGALDGIISELQRAAELASKFDQRSHEEALKAVSGVKVLCGPRETERGVGFWNAEIEKKLNVDSDMLLAFGRPLLVTQNSPRVGLNNGDIGVVVQTESGARVMFRSGKDYRYYSIAELPHVESCFAMTVHKSQGSEYEKYVVVIMPHEESPLLTRELIYTAITRAKGIVRVVGGSSSLRKAIVNPSTRTSGLAVLIGEFA